MKPTLSFKRGEHPSPLVSLGDVADRLGVTPGLVGHWNQRIYLDTPIPIARTAAGPIYWWADWVDWANMHRPELVTIGDREEV